MSETSIGILGAGAFGTALAAVIAGNGAGVALYGRDAGAIDSIVARRINPRLPAITLPESVAATTDFSGIARHDVLLLVVPSAAQVEAARGIAGLLKPGAAIVMCAKGLDKASGTPITDALAAALPGHPLHVLSGPGFAADIATGLPTAMTLASADLAAAEKMAAVLSRKTFRLYASADMVGVQLSGALKNVLAIAAGIVIGAGLGESARAALVARGLAEMTRYVAGFGGQPETAAGLSGLGDLVLTATSAQSRNYRFGLAVGEGQHPDRIVAGGPLVEGAAAAVAASTAAGARGISMPVTDAVAGIVTGRIDVAAAVDSLLSRPLKTETAD
jgi:glycerol-3-phosphate dehydrogenase (NAD(P)+)